MASPENHRTVDRYLTAKSINLIAFNDWKPPPYSITGRPNRFQRVRFMVEKLPGHSFIVAAVIIVGALGLLGVSIAGMFVG